MRIVILFLLSFLFCNGVMAQTPAHLVRPGDTLDKDAFINTVEQSLKIFLDEYVNNKTEYDSIVKALNYEPGEIPTFSDDQICEQLEKMNEMSPFHLDCNKTTLSTIRFFMNNRRGFIRVALGRSSLYFDLFEEKLAEYGLPLELKYLSVIESGLRPQVKSRAGALGLWQFMYRTGRYYGLTENSYIDERMDPVAATDAACRYLKQLYGIYGDWNLALAAYNAGPGNVNKAIRRSGNKTTYWEVRPFLPSETQGYVPNFIAAAYMLNYHAEHNITPMEAKIHYAQLDTVCFSKGVHMNTIEKIIGWDTEDIKALNPIYKTSYIPATNPGQCISGPLEKIGLLVSLEDSLYTLERQLYSYGTPQPIKPIETSESPDTNTEIDSSIVNSQEPTLETYFYHKVKSGENMSIIATKYSVTVEQIMEWNALKTTNIYVGQRLRINKQNPTTSEPAPKQTAVQKKYYTVRSGDTFSKIASRHGLTQAQLQRLNPGVRINRLDVGQRIRVK